MLFNRKNRLEKRIKRLTNNTDTNHIDIVLINTRLNQLEGRIERIENSLDNLLQLFNTSAMAALDSTEGDDNQQQQRSSGGSLNIEPHDIKQ